jgi:hypothetical protein
MLSKIITLYHGSIFEFDEIDVKRGKPFKDFGVGFYTSKIQSHAEGIAKRNLQIEFRRIRDFGLSVPQPEAYLYTYEFDESNLASLKVRQFAAADADWARFVTGNRKSRIHLHDYDIVIGATANDRTMLTINAFLAGVYGDIDDDEAIAMFLKQIEPYKLPSQCYFGTQRAASLLKFVKRSEIR